MKPASIIFSIFLIGLSLQPVGLQAGQSTAQDSTPPALKTPLPQDILNLLINEISGQIIFNNEVKLAGAPWLRNKAEFSDTFYESETLYKIAQAYGLEKVDLERYPREGEFSYPVKGEFWMLEPEKELIARLEADAALIASSSENVDLTARLIYLPTPDNETVKKWIDAGPQESMQNAVALMWSHPGGETAKALDAAGLLGVISFSSRERYFDPDQVVYSRGSYGDRQSMKFGFTVSWRQWSELLEDVESGKKIKVQCKTKINRYPDRFENVFCRIPGTEPDKKGIGFTAHLFEGYTKRGANDNMSGCVIQLEIFRALSKLIAQGALPRPRRTITFLWPNEISGTYERIKQNPGYAESLSININMDMVGEGLRKNNAVFTMSECSNHLPSYLDGMADRFMNYVWRTNDIVYLPGAPRGRRGGQYFPRPMWEKNGSKDAFRYFTHSATGGSDHICFNNSSVAVPSIEFFTWPDQWYHADADTPDKSDPTQMKRVAFIGAASAWAAANCTDDVVEPLLSAVSSYGYKRLGERELPRAISKISQADSESLAGAVDQAKNLVRMAVAREIEAVKSVRQIDTGSPQALLTNDSHVAHWEAYGKALEKQIQDYSAHRAAQLGVKIPPKTKADELEKKLNSIVPDIHPDIKGKEFSLERSSGYTAYLKENPDFIKNLKLNRSQLRSILNFINGKRSLAMIRNWTAAESDKDIDSAVVLRYMEFLKEIQWVIY